MGHAYVGCQSGRHQFLTTDLESGGIDIDASSNKPPVMDADADHTRGRDRQAAEAGCLARGPVLYMVGVSKAK